MSPHLRRWGGGEGVGAAEFRTAPGPRLHEVRGQNPTGVHGDAGSAQQGASGQCDPPSATKRPFGRDVRQRGITADPKSASSSGSEPTPSAPSAEDPVDPSGLNSTNECVQMPRGETSARLQGIRDWDVARVKGLSSLISGSNFGRRRRVSGASWLKATVPPQWANSRDHIWGHSIDGTQARSGERAACRLQDPRVDRSGAVDRGRRRTILRGRDRIRPPDDPARPPPHCDDPALC